MAKSSKLLVNIPFSGFTDSEWSRGLCHAAEREAEWRADRQGEDGVPIPLRLTASDYGDLIHEHMDYATTYEHISKQYLATLGHLVSEHVGFALDLRWESLTSPRQYNYETDRLWANIGAGTVRRLFAASKRGGHAKLSAAIADRFTSRPGFWSHYSNVPAAWLAKPVLDWDHNELGTLLLALMSDVPTPGHDHCGTLSSAIYETLSDNDAFEAALHHAVDWSAFAAAVEDRRAGLTSDANLDLAAPTWRCPDTLITPVQGLTR